MKRCLVLLLLACMMLLPAAAAEEPESEAVESAATEAEVLELPGNGGQDSAPAAAELLPGFEDQNFCDWVMAHCDRDGDGTISDAEARAVTSMDVSGLNIASLAGLGRFSALKTLNCSNNLLTSLDLSGNPALTTLLCHGNALGWVDVGACPSLKKTVTTICPTLSGDSTAFMTKVKKSRVAAVQLPKDAAILIGGAAYYDPAVPLTLLCDAVTLGVKEKLTLLPQNSGIPALYCTLTTSSKKIAKIDAKGVVTGVKTGIATVTVSLFDGRSASCNVTVMKAPTAVALSAKSLTLCVDETAPLTAAIPENTASALTWTNTDPGVAGYEGGLVKGLKPGKTTLTVKTFNGKKASCVVSVYAEPDSLSLSEDSLSLFCRQKASVTPVFPQGTYSSITWVSDRPACVHVDPETGEMTALEEGEAVITATTRNGVSAACHVTVTPGPDRIVLGIPAAVTLGAGDSISMSAEALRDDGVPVSQQLTYVSSADKYAAVTASGVIQAKKKGAAVITVSAPNGVKAECSVTVVKAPSSIRLNKTSLKLQRGSHEKLTVDLSGSASAIAWQDYDPNIISVSEDGTVTALATGVTGLTARTYNNKTATCTVQVTLSAEDIANYRATHPLIAVAHRGGAAYWPENTLEAFSHSASTGADMIELDVQTTSDGVQVIHHDASFKAGGKTYKIPKKTYKALKAAKPSLCTLDEALELIYRTGLDIQLELKESADAKKCVEAVARNKMKDRTWYISFKTEQLKRVRALDGSAKLGYIFQKSIPKDLNSTIASLRISALMVHQDLLTQTRLDDWHMSGLLVNVWTVNNKSDCRKFAKMGVDFITSNYPDYAAAVK